MEVALVVTMVWMTVTGGEEIWIRDGSIPHAILAGLDSDREAHCILLLIQLQITLYVQYILIA